MNKLFFTLITVAFCTYLQAQSPTITSFSPVSGSVGSLVTITGTNLNNPTVITIGGVSALQISNTGTSLVAMVMPGAATGNIGITTAGGNSNSVGNFTIVANVPPAAQQGSKLVGTGNVGDYSYQGYSSSISADGNTAIVGGYLDNNNQGAAWIYVRNGNIWSQQGLKLVGTGAIGSAGQGQSVAVSADGNTVVVGGSGDNSFKGAVWVYVRIGNSWSQQGNKLVGTGSIGQCGQGKSVAISADGNTIITGGSSDNNYEGAAWIFTRTGGIWNQQGNKLVGTGNVFAAQQAAAVSISADGNTAITGSDFDNNKEGAAWIFIRSNGIWTQQGNKLVGTGSVLSTYNQGVSVSISADGNTAILGRPADNNLKGAIFVFTRSGSSWSQQGSKLVGTGNTGAQIGSASSISADGNTIIGAGENDTGNMGASWVFTRSGGIWSQQGNKRIGTGNSGFAYQGSSVSISADGNTAITGGYADNGAIGAAWVYYGALAANANLDALTISSGSLTPIFSATTTNYTVNVSNATTSVIVTPTRAEPNATIQVRINSGSYSPVTSGTPSASLSLNVGDNIIEIMVTAQDGSTIKIYTITVTRLAAQQPTITSFIPASGPVGSLVTITGTNFSNPTTIAIGGISAIVISNSGTTLVAMVMPGTGTGIIKVNIVGGSVNSNSNFTVIASLPPNTQQGNKLVGTGNTGVSGQGAAIAISADGNTAIVGGLRDNNYQGAAWVYTRSGNNWNQQGNKLVGTGNIGAAQQGWSVSISADGNTAIVGGNADDGGKGAAWVYKRNGSTWSQQGTKLVGTGNIGAAQQGWSVGISADGNTAIVGGNFDNVNLGAAWMFIRNGSVWSQQGNKLVGAGYIGASNQGVSVGISADGNTVIVGGWNDNSNQGAAWIFIRSGAVWSQQGNKLVGSGNVGSAEQGSSVSISADGNTVIVGGYTDNTSKGAVWVFVRSGSTWNQQGGKLVGTGSIGQSAQGAATSISADGNTILVGGNTDNNYQGAAWIFTRNTNIWSQQGNKLVGTGSVGQPGQASSVSLSADGNTAILGGNGDNGSMGAAWVFVSSSTLPVNITNLKAYQKNTSIQVEWNTQNEINMSNYEVEKSNDGSRFRKAGTIIATGLSMYNWFDVSPMNGNNYYRLKMIDKDGSFKYSPIVNVKIGGIKNVFTIAGNPIKNKTLVLQMENVDKGNYTISMYNNLGQQIISKTIVHESGSATQTLYLGTLSAGIYQLNIIGNNVKVNKTIVAD